MIFDHETESVLSLGVWPGLQALERRPGHRRWVPTTAPDLLHLGNINCWLDYKPVAYEPRPRLEVVTGLDAYRGFLGTIPPDVLMCVNEYQSDSRSWRILQAFRYFGRDAKQLVKENHYALLYMLANLDAFVHDTPDQPWPQAARLLRRRGPCPDILRPLGFFPDWATVNVLKRVVPGTCTVKNLRLLRRLLRYTPLHTAIMMLPRINEGSLTMLRYPWLREHCPYSLMMDIATNPNDDVVGLSAADYNEVRLALEAAGDIKDLRYILRLSVLQEVHRMLTHPEQNGDG